MVTAAEHEQLSSRGFLAELLLGECDDRDRRRSARRVKASRPAPPPTASPTPPIMNTGLDQRYDELRALEARTIRWATRRTDVAAVVLVGSFALSAARLRDDAGALIGGISGHTHFGWLVIAQLWVAETHRGQHVGRDLLLAAEHEAQQRGCHSAWLDTYSFQAKPFYEAHGYRLFGELERYPAPHTKQFLAKHL